MAVVNVQQAVQPILGAMLDYLSLLVVFVLIYMLFKLVAGDKSVGDLFGRREGPDREGRRGKDGGGTKDGGEQNGPEDTSKEYGDWADGFGTVTVLVTDEDDNKIQGAHVTIKHRKIPKMSKKMWGYTGTNGTFGPKRIPAGPIMVKATHRNWFQYAVSTVIGATLLGITGIAGALGILGTDRYVMKDWFILEKDAEEIFHIRLKRKKAQPDTGFEPKIVDITFAPDHVQLRGKID
jgi:hypothetical protein